MTELRTATAVLFLDIDGTVREGLDDPLGRLVNGPEDVRVFPAAVERMRAWVDGGGIVVGISNQGGIPLGYTTDERVDAAMGETMRQAEGLFTRIRWCPHHPDALNPRLRRCVCRKPRTGLVAFQVADMAAAGVALDFEHSIFVGDRLEDRACAAAADLNFLWARDWRAGAPYSSAIRP